MARSEAAVAPREAGEDALRAEVGPKRSGFLGIGRPHERALERLDVGEGASSRISSHSSLR
jgi:hypothetical protein